MHAWIRYFNELGHKGTLYRAKSAKGNVKALGLGEGKKKKKKKTNKEVVKWFEWCWEPRRAPCRTFASDLRVFEIRAWGTFVLLKEMRINPRCVYIYRSCKATGINKAYFRRWRSERLGFSQRREGNVRDESGFHYRLVIKALIQPWRYLRWLADWCGSLKNGHSRDSKSIEVVLVYRRRPGLENKLRRIKDSRLCC